MDATIFLFLLQDGIINGAVYALVAIATVLVFAVTRVILVPQGEFVAFTALTIAALENGHMPSTPWLLLALGCLAAASELIRHFRELTARRRLPQQDRDQQGIHCRSREQRYKQQYQAGDECA